MGGSNGRPFKMRSQCVQPHVLQPRNNESKYWKSLDMTMRLKAEQSTITRKHKYSQPENSYPPDNAFISSATLLPLGPSDQNFSFHLPQAPLPPRTLSPSLTLIPTGPARLADVSSCMP